MSDLRLASKTIPYKGSAKYPQCHLQPFPHASGWLGLQPQYAFPRRQVVTVEKVLHWNREKLEVFTSSLSSLEWVNVDLNLISISKINIILSNEKRDHQPHANSINAALQAEWQTIWGNVSVATAGHPWLGQSGLHWPHGSCGLRMRII